MATHLSRQWERLPFIARLLVTASTALLVAGMAMLFFSARQEASEIRDDLKVELTKELETLPAALAEIVVIGDFSTLQQTLDRYVARPLVVSARFKDTSGAELFSTVPYAFSEAPAWFIRLFDFSDVTGRAPVIVGGRSYGELHLTLSSQGLSERAWNHLRSHLAILLLAVFIDFLGIWLVLRTSLSPLKELEDGANALAAGRLDVRLSPSGSPELRKVIDSFNHMALALKSGNLKIEAQRIRLSNILEGTNVGTWEWNTQTGEVRFNERWAEIIGYRLDELQPITIDTWMCFAHPEDLEESASRLRKHFSGELPYYECEARMRHRDGHWVWVLDRGRVATWSDDGQPLWMFGTHQDITETKRAQQALEALLTDHENLIANLPVGVYKHRTAADGSTRFDFVSPTWCEQIGVSEAEVHSNPALLLDIIHPGDLESFRSAIERAHATGNPLSWTGRILRNGEIRWLHMESTLHFQDNGDLVCDGIQADVTAQEMAKLALESAKTAAEAANVAKSRFLATMSHEIRTPMNGILGMAQLLLSDGVSKAEQQDYARIILNSGQALLALLNDILDLSKVEAGKLDLDLAPFSPTQMLHETRTLFLEAAHKKHLRIETAWAGEAMRHYRGDSHRLRQMLSNLVGNAIKFTERGEIRIEGREIAQEDGGTVLEFAVSDTGIGIPEDKLSLLFKPFSQADSSTTRRFGGTGLGLSIVHSLAHLMGGSAGVDSQPGRGSRFWFRIRAAIIPTSEELCQLPPAATGANQPSAQAAGRSGRVLVVEDNATNRKVVTAMLTRLGMETLQAEDGRLGLEAVMGGAPIDLILMDVHMPVMDGCAATESIRQWEQESGRPRQPIVALTASAFEEDRQRCLASGMDDFLTKPVMLDPLQAVLSRWLPREASPPAPLPVDKAPSARTADMTQIVAILDELLPALAQNKFSAFRQFEQLKELVDETDMATEIADAGKPLADLRFDLVQERLLRVAEAHSWEIGTP